MAQNRQQEMLEEFRAYHRANPQVYRLFAKYTQELIAAGFKHAGAGLIFERMRWHTRVETNDPHFKLCNNHRPYYARAFELLNPQHKDFFRKRTLVSANRPANTELETLNYHNDNADTLD